MTKIDYAKALTILLDMPREEYKELEKLSLPALRHIFEGLKKNALAYNELKNTRVLSSF